MTALLCHSVTVMDVTMMAPLCQRCHHDGCHRDGTAVPQCHRDGHHHDSSTVPTVSQ